LGNIFSFPEPISPSSSSSSRSFPERVVKSLSDRTRRARWIARKCFFLLIVACPECGHAETQRVGPVDLKINLNDIDIPLVVRGALDVSSAKGDFNINGEIAASFLTSDLRSAIISISAKVLPAKIPTPACELLLNRISSIEVSSKDNEADVDATFHLSLQHCGPLNNGDSEANLKIAVIAKVAKGNRLTWTIPRRPELDIPRSWWYLLNLAKGNPNDYARNSLQQLLDEHGAVEIPPIQAVRTALQGANFDGDKNTLSFRIKGDAHADGRELTPILVEILRKSAPLNFTIPKFQ
jgi:hypothetical protein